MIPYKNTSAASTEKKEREYTNNNQPTPAHMLCARTEMREKHCSEWQRAAPNRIGWSFPVEVCSIASCIIPVADYVSLILCVYQRNIAKNTIPRQFMLQMVDQTSLCKMCCRFKFDAQHGHNNLQKILSRPGNVMVSNDNIPMSCVQVAWDHSHLLCLFRKMTVMVHMDSAVPVKNYKRYQIL